MSSSAASFKLSPALRYSLLCCAVLLVFASLSRVFVATKPSPPTQEELNAGERLKIRAEVEELSEQILEGEQGVALPIQSSMKLTANQLLQEEVSVFIAEDIPSPVASEPSEAEQDGSNPELEEGVEAEDDAAEDKPNASSSQSSSAIVASVPQAVKSNQPALANSPALANASTFMSKQELSLGENIYMKHCMRCHQEDGLGRAEAHWPPLQGSEWLLQPVDVLARIVLHGLSGPIQVNGVSYGEAMMTPLGHVLDDAEIAAVLNYVRENFAQPYYFKPIKASEVALVRAESLSRDPSRSWTQAELKPFFIEIEN